MIEVEIKAEISSPDTIRKKFLEKNGIYKISLSHEDTYFNMPRKLRDFRKTDEALRIRKSIEFDKKKKDQISSENFYLTYKGKKLDDTTKSRKELELKIEDGSLLTEIFKKLGFSEVFTVKKERELYEFDYKGSKIEALLDYIPILKQNFIEVEMITSSENELAHIRNILFEFLNEFGIKKKNSIRKSYLELICDLTL